MPTEKKLSSYRLTYMTCFNWCMSAYFINIQNMRQTY